MTIFVFELSMPKILDILKKSTKELKLISVILFAKLKLFIMSKTSFLELEKLKF
jgi:hypothetical protein